MVFPADDACTGHQKIYGAESLFGFSYHFLDLFRIGNIGFESGSLSAILNDCLNGFFSRLGIRGVVHGDSGSPFCKVETDCTPDTPGTSGHQSGFSFKIFFHFHSFSNFQGLLSSERRREMSFG